MTALIFALGLVTLVFGAQVLIRGVSKLAVSVRSAWGGQVDIALGNVVGSNIFNVLFILGVSALIAPLVVAPQLIRQEVPIMLGASVLLFGLALDGATAAHMEWAIWVLWTSSLLTAAATLAAGMLTESEATPLAWARLIAEREYVGRDVP